MITPPTPYGTAPAAPPGRRRRGGVVGPLLLIFIGSIFLLQNMGFLPPTFWLNLWRLWPLVLVLAGLELVFAHRLPWLGLAAFAAVLLVGGAIAVHSRPTGVGGPRLADTSRLTRTDLNGASQAQVAIHFGAGQLDVGAIVDPGPSQLAAMAYDGPADVAPRPRYVVARGGIGQLAYELEGHERSGMPFLSGDGAAPHMLIELNPSVPLTSMTVETGATNAHLDLSSLQLKSLEMSVGAATTWVRLPRTDGTSTVHVSGGASSITLEVPNGTAASIRHRGGLSTVAVDTTRFTQVADGLYRSVDYDTAQSRVDITLETGFTTIQVN